MTRTRSQHQLLPHSDRVTTTEISNFISPDDEIIEDTEEVTLEKLIDPYRPLLEPTVDDEDDSERPRLMPSIEAREAMSILKLYIQQQWDPGMLRLAFDVEDETGIAAQKALFSLERHLCVLQLRRAQKQSSITSYFKLSGSYESPGPRGGTGGDGTVVESDCNM